MTQHKHAAVLRAIADGKDVGFSISGDIWTLYNERAHCSPLAMNNGENQGYYIQWRVEPIEEYQVVYSVGEHNYLTHQWYVSKEEFDDFYIPVKGEAKFICFVKETGRERNINN